MVTPQALDQTIVMKRVFLTGASSGIGRAIAHALLARGDEVWGTSRNLERIPKMPRWHAVRLDLTDPLSVEGAFSAALTDARYFDVVINNAGAGHFDPAELVPMETIASQFQILVFGQIQLMQLALRHMRARGEGLVINVHFVSFPASSAVYGGLQRRESGPRLFYHVDPARARQFPRARCGSSAGRHSHRI
jgi:NAD(P)-dependent dehydrogenase (short-subunit alcohol dehydrogenase family)